MTTTELFKFIRSFNYSPVEDDFNIVVLRNSNIISNKYDDTLYYYYKTKDGWVTKKANVTSKPGLYYIENPINKNGTAILVPGLYKDCWVLGKHKGLYPALVQLKQLPVYRDSNKDRTIDTSIIENGHFGINIHRSKLEGSSTEVNKYSAGCIVFSNASEYDKFINTIKSNINKRGTYSLLLIDNTKKVTFKKMETLNEQPLDNINVETVKQNTTLEVSQSLVESIRKFQYQFSELNNQLELMIKGYLIGQNIDSESYRISFSEDLKTMTLEKK
jgi:hypothetical protein